MPPALELSTAFTSEQVSGRGRGAGSGRGSVAPRSAKAKPRPVSLAEQLDSFWRSGLTLADLHVSPLAGGVPDALLRQLGPAPVEVAGKNLVEVLAPAYTPLSEEAERRALE